MKSLSGLGFRHRGRGRARDASLGVPLYLSIRFCFSFFCLFRRTRCQNP